MAERVAFCGEQFVIAERIGLMPLMRFAKTAKAGADTETLEGLAAMYDLLEQCLAPQEWQRFQDHADASRADGDELMKVVQDVFEVLSARPTSRPADSSAGPPSMPASSTGDSSSRVIHRFEEQGRPDLALLVQSQASQAG